MEEYDESHTNKLSRKVKENPFMPIGICGLLMACGYGAYMFKRRGKMSTSVYLMQLRVAAQGTVVGTLTIGVIFSMINRYVLKSDKSAKN
ncbi:HIG1 domain family member 1A, mitochondrial-like [Rhodnius prolixus]|uniref:HIG1 domain-containing protein n=1 Tax=Rhodnius prolixus TaxID=13249 RepID=T1I5P0_RHOPR